MKEVDALIYSRLTNDSGIISLMGGSANRIKYGFQRNVKLVPLLTFFQFSATPGNVTGNFARTWEYFYQFTVFDKQYPEILSRLKRLFDGHVFTISGSYEEIGSVYSLWDWEGVESHEEGLETTRKDTRYRFLVVPKAQDPI